MCRESSCHIYCIYCRSSRNHIYIWWCWWYEVMWCVCLWLDSRLPCRVFCAFSAFDNVHQDQFKNYPLNAADVIIVCDKLDTGFNEPAVMAMYIDRPLHSASRIVQLLSRANRCHEMKTCVHVLDFVNHPLHVRRREELCVLRTFHNK